jgi:hypothetical protein
MTISVRLTRIFASFTHPRAVRMALTATLLGAAVLVAPGTADARRAVGGYAGSYDGTWNVTFATRAGNCSATYNAPFAVYGRQVSSAGGGKVTGGITRNGVVSVRISVGASVATGSGRLAGNSGAGRWSGLISGDRCSGVWQATRG